MKKIGLPLLLILIGIGTFLFGTLYTSKGGDVEVEIVKRKNIMPAAHNVYSNKNVGNGQYYLFKAKITNKTNKKLEDVVVSYEIPGIIRWEKLELIGEMLPGQTASVVCYPKFDAKITKKTTKSNEKVNIKITWDDAEEDDEIEENFDFVINSRNDFFYTNIPEEELIGWADVFADADLLACMITPNDPIVKYYTQNIQQKVLKGETASVTQTSKEALRFLLGVYQATLQSKMVYSGTGGTPGSTADGFIDFSQNIRLPREVITGNTGLCIELSLLYASILSNAGLDAVIYLIPGHAYPGFRLNGQYYAIESTGIGGEGIGGSASAEQAFETGMKELKNLMKGAKMGDPRYRILDISQLHNQGITPMSLEDDSFLRKKVDDITLAWTGNKKMTPKKKKRKSIDRQQRIITHNNSSTRRREFAFPGNFQTYSNPSPLISTLSYQAVSPNGQVSISVFDVPTNNQQEAMRIIQQELYKTGQSIEYQFNGRTIRGNTYASGNTFTWRGKIINKGSSGLRFIAVGALSYNYNYNSSLINNIYNSIP